MSSEWRIAVPQEAKESNGEIIRSAVAFGVKEVWVVGNPRKRVATFGAKGAEVYVSFVFFDNWNHVHELAVVHGLNVTGISASSNSDFIERNKKLDAAHECNFPANSLFVIGRSPKNDAR